MNKKLDIFGGIKWHDIHTMESVGCQSSMDWYVNENAEKILEMVKRPGLGVVYDTGSIMGDENDHDYVRGLYSLPLLHRVVLQHNSRLKWLTKRPSGEVVMGYSGKLLSGTGLASIVSDGDLVFACNGNEVMWTDMNGNEGLCEGVRDIVSIHIMNDLLLAVSKDGNVYYTDPATLDRKFFDGRSFAPSMHGGTLVGVLVMEQYIYLMTDNLIEAWVSSGDEAVFAPVPSMSLQLSLAGPFALCWVGALQPYFSQIHFMPSIIFLNNERQVMQHENSTLKLISDDIAGLLRGLVRTDDCEMHYLNPEGKLWLVMHFPTDGKTFVYDFTTSAWTQFGFRNPLTGSWEAFLGNCFCFSDAFGGCLAGSRKDGNVYRFSHDYFRDGDNPIVAEFITNCTENGTGARKRSVRIDLECYKGVRDTSVAPTDTNSYLLMDTSDEAQTLWGNRERIIPLGGLGAYRSMIHFSALGSYRTRAYKFRTSDDAPLTISSATEEIILLNSWYTPVNGGQTQ